MRELIEELKKVGSGINTTIEVYNTLEAKLHRTPQPENVIVPVLYAKAREYNREHHLLPEFFMSSFGAWISRQYPGLEHYFIDEEGIRAAQEMTAQLNEGFQEAESHKEGD